jgi:hypothetical protein
MTWRPSSFVSKAHFVCQGYFNETWYEDTFGQHAKIIFLFSRFDVFCGLQAAILKIRLVVVKCKLTKFLWEVYLIRLHHILPGFWI